MPELAVARSVKVCVPASSANLGPGFDCLGLALSLCDEVTVTVQASGLDLTIDGEGAGDLPTDETHLVVQAIRAGLTAAGFTAPGLAVRCLNRIPQSRGLGSSASAAVAGIAAAQALTGYVLSTEDMVQLAGEFEGHPDNSSASILGGAIVSWTQDHNGEPRYRAARIPVVPTLRATALVPDTCASTSEVRAVLPEQVPHLDARFNLSRSALLTYALQHDAALLFEATRDMLHQPYRAAALPMTTAWMEKLRAVGIAAFVSGAGSTVLALHEEPVPGELVAEAEAAGLSVHHLTLAEGVRAEILAT